MATAKRKIDAVTKRWIGNASDERAARNGCRFDEERGQFVVDWIGRYCKLYEGEWAGQPIRLMEWQADIIKRLFGWVRLSEEWGREVRRFRRASIWAPKKSGKSPLIACLGLYLLCGDGEQGQKVFSAAKDGEQAKISHMHAIEMVRQSPELSAECRINKSTLRITHEASRSFYSILAADNFKGKEGINGSVMIDETHVVDRRFARVIHRAGISRSEPLQIEVSTAGNDPDGYGKEQFDNGRKVESGEFEDEELFFQAFAAPQELEDSELDKDPVRWGKLANPSWGHTVKEKEYLSDYHRAHVSLSELADFKMYRLNIWQHSTNPWIRMSDWEKCKRDFTPTDLEGRRCYSGLDLSKTRDMTALVLVFPMDADDEYRLLPFFWLPEQVAREKNHLVPFLSWAKAGYLELTPGNVVDYGFIRARFRELAKRYKIMDLVYDATYAEETTQALEQGVTDATGKLIEEGTGVRRIVFPQTITAFTDPSKDFERLIIAGKLHHNGNPIMNWQIGHVQIKTDPNANIRPVKPKPDDVRKIDGVVAAIMGLSQAVKSMDAEHWYTPGVLTS